MPSNANLSIIPGENYQVIINITDGNGAAIDLTSFSISGWAKYQYSNTGKLFDLQPYISNSTGGLVGINLPSTGTAFFPIGEFPYDVEVANSVTGTAVKILYGKAIVGPPEISN